MYLFCKQLLSTFLIDEALLLRILESQMNQALLPLTVASAAQTVSKCLTSREFGLSTVAFQNCTSP
jgi:hypothetical protein